MTFSKYGSKASTLSGLVDFICCSFASIASICLVLKGFDNKLSQINASSSSSIMLSWKNGINHSKKLLNWTCEIDPIFTWLIVPIQQKCLNPFNFSPDAAACVCTVVLKWYVDGYCIYLTTRLQKMLQETLLHLFLASSASASEQWSQSSRTHVSSTRFPQSVPESLLAKFPVS